MLLDQRVRRFFKSVCGRLAANSMYEHTHDSPPSKSTAVLVGSRNTAASALQEKSRLCCAESHLCPSCVCRFVTDPPNDDGQPSAGRLGRPIFDARWVTFSMRQRWTRKQRSAATLKRTSPLECQRCKAGARRWRMTTSTSAGCMKMCAHVSRVSLCVLPPSSAAACEHLLLSCPPAHQSNLPGDCAVA